MEGRVGDGLEAAGAPRSPLHVVFVDFERDSFWGFMESIEPIEAAGIIPHARMMAEITLQTATDAKMFGDLKDDALSLDFVAVLMKYSEEDTKPALYADLNACCYNRDRTKMTPYAQFVWLLMHAMRALEPYPQIATVFRGVKRNLSSIYVKGRELTWHGFASCTKSMGVLMNPQFCGPGGARTIFVIALTQGQAREITRYSLNAHEDEVLLPPGCRFRVMDTAPMDDGLLIVQLQEIASREWILDLALPSPAGTEVRARRNAPSHVHRKHVPACSAAVDIPRISGGVRVHRASTAAMRWVAALLIRPRLCRMWTRAGAGGEAAGGGIKEAAGREGGESEDGGGGGGGEEGGGGSGIAVRPIRI
jgi:hypothetical protein